MFVPVVVVTTAVVVAVNVRVVEVVWVVIGRKDEQNELAEVWAWRRDTTMATGAHVPTK